MRANGCARLDRPLRGEWLRRAPMPPRPVRRVVLWVVPGGADGARPH